MATRSPIPASPEKVCASPPSATPSRVISARPRVIKAEQVPEANKLLKLTLSLGGDETRQVFAGIKAAYEPEALTGRLVVMVANLQPRKMRFGLSEGMVTAAGPGGSEVFVLGVDDGAQPGQRVH